MPMKKHSTAVQAAAARSKRNRNPDESKANFTNHRLRPEYNFAPEVNRNRRPTISGIKGQAVHSSAYGMLLAGFDRIMENYNSGGSVPISSLRNIRAMTSDHIRRLTVLNNAFPPFSSNPELTELHKQIKKIITEYNDLRANKTAIARTKAIFLCAEVLRVAETKRGNDIENKLEELSKSSENLDSEMIDYLSSYSMVNREETKAQLLKLRSISTKTAALDAASSVNLDSRNLFNALVEQAEARNEDLIKRECEKLTFAAMSFYNKLKGSAFKHADGEPKSVRRPKGKVLETTALAYMRNYYGKAKTTGLRIFLEAIDHDGERPATDHSTQELIKSIDGLLDYYEKPQHLASYRGSHTLDPAMMCNDKEDLINILARHLYIFFNIYPEAAEQYGCDIFKPKPDYTKLREEVIYEFIDRILIRDWSTMCDTRAKQIEIEKDASSKFEILVESPADQSIDTVLKYAASSTGELSSRSNSDSEGEHDSDNPQLFRPRR